MRNEALSTFRLMRGVLFLAMLMASAGASAYPQYIAKGHAQCAGCHFNPMGGGMATQMGRSSLSAILPDLFSIQALKKARIAATKEDPLGKGSDGESRFQAIVGFDARFLFLRSIPDIGEEPAWFSIPMLLEAGTFAAYGRWSAYATVTPRRRSTEENRYSVASREHWLAFELDVRNSLRVGRTVLPFGLRMADHTLYTREDFSFDKFDQSYAVSWDHVANRSELHVAAFAGDLGMTPPVLQERGAAASASWSFFDEQLSLGASALLGISQAQTRPALSVFARARPFGATYVLAELAGQRRMLRDLDAAQSSAASLLRVGWLLHDSTDLYVETSGRWMEGGSELTKLRYQVGLDTHLLPWVELSPALLFEEDEETGLKSSFFAQLHLSY